ncbi:hypothetical protein JKF63_01659 [Porcisia hertigi]|uniref:Uncharacterized protein n=1 Tax=Porcisia hertigi TaxID=2761500 RepID=A0A836H549_9TRYP|nr:hypothetical protein JKF63_01659 [Porcisia hertigi]
MTDADSIDTPPRVVPQTAPGVSPVTIGVMDRSNQLQQQRGLDLQDVFQPSKTEGGQTEHRETERQRSDNRSSTSSSSSCMVYKPSMTVTASRARVPSKDILYGRRTDPQHSTSPSRMTVTSPFVGNRDNTHSGHETSQLDLPPTSSSASPGPSLAQRYRENAATAHTVAASVASTSAKSTSPSRRSRIAKFIVDVEGDPDVSTDALLKRMQAKEREFDAKIHQIHHTFQNAGEQLVVRDQIISHLKEELASLRTEASRIPKEYHAREEKLLLRVETMMNELSEEQRRAHHARRSAEEDVGGVRESLQTAEQQLAQQQRISDDLLRQLRASDKALQEEKQRHTTALAESRRAYEAKLSELQRTFRSMEKEVAKSRSRLEDVEKDRCQQQAKLLELELSGRRRLSSETVKAKELLTENEALRDEVEVVRLSMARLLRLMSEVPAMSEYLQWNELSSEFVFLGYPTRYFDTSYRGRGVASSPSSSWRTGSRGASPRQQQRSPARRHGAGGTAGDDTSLYKHGPSRHSSGYYHDANVSSVSVGDTGVEDGVYAGVAASLSKNVWLNGRWAQEMLSIIAAENNFTRLKRIKLLELEEAAQLSEQLPSARDVLECRQPEHHYWIPYAVFMEAQKFKNKYYPRLPAMSHFSPFLIQLNKIWRTKLQDRLRVMQQQKQQQQRSSHVGCSTAEDSRYSMGTRTRGSDTGDQRSSSTSRLTNRCDVAPPPKPGDLFSEWTRQESRMDEIRAEHHRLRREVRLHVSSQKSLQLFRLYDDLVRGAHQTIGDVLRLAEDLYDNASAQHYSGAEDREHASASALCETKQQMQPSEEITGLVAARDQLLRIVEQASERVCDVGDSLSNRMMSYYNDLHQLIHMLHHHIRQARERSRHKTRAHVSNDGTESNSSASSSTAQSSGGASNTLSSTAELQRRPLGLLWDQYGMARGAGADGDRAEDAATVPGAGNSDALLKLAASVLDFGEEVRREVTQATAALHVVAEQAMKEAAQCHGA